jgi:hypothetical protein
VVFIDDTNQGTVLSLSHKFIFRFFTNSLIISGFLCNGDPDNDLGQMAPVGHACMHFPHEVQVTESPHGVLKSEMTRTLKPRFITSQLYAPSTSPHTRTQRVHMIHRLWSMTI